MFTGIVEEIGRIISITSLGLNQIALTIGCHQVQEGLKLGDSIAVNGVCLTVVRFDDEAVVFELSGETLKSTTFQTQSIGRNVNLERALKLNDRLGGHIVQGHVDCIARLIGRKEQGEFFELDFSLPEEIAKYVVKKGSIAVNGISLTVADMTADTFSIAVIPHTYKQTTLCDLKNGDSVHLESDILGRYIEKLMFSVKEDRKDSKITLDFLEKHGF